jgi:glycerophosphoryl diester phosphodiesterase
VTRPLIIAHRGDARAGAENTLVAFEAALAAGVDGIELDLHRTRDGTAVVHHDPVPAASVGDPGLAGRPFVDLDAADVARFRHPDGSGIPTLEAVLDLVGSRATLYCELKGEGAVEAVAPLLARHRGPCAMHAFDHRAVREAARLAPGVPRGILVVSRLVDTWGALRAAHATTLWPQLEFVDADLLAELHAGGGAAIAWTVNEAARGHALAALGIDGICTDRPDTMRAALPSTESTRPA